MSLQAFLSSRIYEHMYMCGRTESSSHKSKYFLKISVPAKTQGSLIKYRIHDIVENRIFAVLILWEQTFTVLYMLRDILILKCEIELEMFIKLVFVLLQLRIKSSSCTYFVVQAIRRKREQRYKGIINTKRPTLVFILGPTKPLHSFG